MYYSEHVSMILNVTAFFLKKKEKNVVFKVNPDSGKKNRNQ